MSKLPEINFGLLDEHQLNFLKRNVQKEIDKRGETPEEYIKVVYFEDGAEGVFCPIDMLNKIPAEDLKSYIIDTIEKNNVMKIDVSDFNKEEYQRECAQYEWHFGDGTNTPVLEDEEEDY